MIFRNITLKAWRNFLGETSVGPFSDGLNIIYGPNGTGKSTLFEALQFAMLNPFKSSGKDMDTIQPWGRSLTPSVTVEFACKDDSYQISKTFLSGCACEVRRFENGNWQPYKDGSSAHEFVREMISKEAPGRGLAKQEHWGLAQILWAPQGNMQLPSLSGSMVEDIRRALGVQVTDSSSGPFEKRIEEFYSQYYTDNSKEKKDFPLKRLRQELAEVEVRLAEIREENQKLENLSRKVEDLAGSRRQLEQHRKELDNAKSIKERQAEAYNKEKTGYEKAKSGKETAELRYNNASNGLSAVESLESKQNELKAKTEKNIPILNDLEKEVKNREKQEEEGKERRESIGKQLVDVDNAMKTANDAKEYLGKREALERFEAKIRAAEEYQNKIRESKEQLNALIAPTPKELKKIRKCRGELDALTIQLNASLIILEIEPEIELNLKVEAGELEGKSSIKPGSKALIKGSPRIIAQISGVGRLSASGPAVDAQQLREELSGKQEEFDTLCAPFNTNDVNELETMQAGRDKLEKVTGEAIAKLEGILGDESLDDHKGRALRTLAEITQLNSRYPAWEKSPPDAGSLSMAAVEFKTKFEQAKTDAESALATATAALASAREQYIALNAENQTQLAQLDQTGRELTALLERKGKQELQKEKNEASIQWTSACAQFDVAEKNLAAYGMDPEEDLEGINRQINELNTQLDNKREEENITRGKLESIAAKGPYTLLCRLEEQKADIQAKITVEDTRMKAISLLKKTMSSIKEAMVQTISQPVQKAASRTLARIAGSGLGAIAVSDSFYPIGVQPPVINHSITLEDVSGGEKEQVYFATRLALAEILAGRERQAVVMDDVLTATDMGRFVRIQRILEELAQKIQIIILTCHKEKYLGMKNAAYFDLESIIGDDART